MSVGLSWGCRLPLRDLSPNLLQLRAQACQAFLVCQLSVVRRLVSCAEGHATAAQVRRTASGMQGSSSSFDLRGRQRHMHALLHTAGVASAACGSTPHSPSQAVFKS